MYIDFDKKDVDLKSLQKDVEKFDKLTSKVYGEKAIDLIEHDDYYSVWIMFESRTFFNVKKSHYDKEIKVSSEGRIDNMPIDRACDVFTDWAEIFNAINECFSKYL